VVCVPIIKWSRLTPGTRLDRYAEAFAPHPQTRTPVQASSSFLAGLRSANNIPSRSRDQTSYSNADIKSVGLQQTGKVPSKLPRSSSMSMSPSQAYGASYWTEGIPPSPRIFPGVVHERTRRGSVRYGSSSEKDLNASERPKLSAWEQNDKSPYAPVPEESGQQETMGGSS